MRSACTWLGKENRGSPARRLARSAGQYQARRPAAYRRCALSHHCRGRPELGSRRPAGHRHGRGVRQGMPRDYPRRWNQDMEAMVNPHVTHLAPRLLWRVQDHWDLLGFEVVRGRHADYRPGSPDLPYVARAAAELGTTPCPDLPIKRAEHRWREYIPKPAELAMLAGDNLLHTDYNPLNILITGGRAVLVDWAWPTKGAGWIDPTCLILRLIAHGHTTQSAEAVIADTPAWQTAPAHGIAIFARACASMWHEIAIANPTGWTQRMAQAAS